MTERTNFVDSDRDLKNSVEEAAEKIKEFSEELRSKLQALQVGAEDKALGLLQTVENVSEKLNIKTDAEAKAFELMESVDHLNEKLQSYVIDFESKLSESQLQFHLGLMEAMGKWEQVKTQANSMLGSVHLDPTPASKIFDEVKLRATLGKMETLELIEKGRDEWNKAWQQVSHQSTVAVKQMNDSIGEIIHRFI